MLICIHCQSSNPEDHKFCQNCGSSLHEKPCPQCHRPVAFGVETCPECGASTAVYYTAIIKGASSNWTETDTDYLDKNQRYRRITCPATTATNSALTHVVRVVDTQPLQPTNLFILSQEKPELVAAETQPSEIATRTSNGSVRVTPVSAKISLPAELPSLAIPYLRLSQHRPTVPAIHEAWQEANAEIIIISDRALCPKLVDLWQDQPQILDQLLHFYDRMAQLWDELAKVNCCTSLLHQDNLVLDEDENLGLAQLIVDSADAVPQLQKLASIWQKLLQIEVPTPLADLIELLAQGKIQQVEQLRSHLNQIALELQPVEEITHNSNTFLLVDETVEADLNKKIEELDELIALDQEDDEISTIILPMQLRHISHAGATDIGKQREHNEDYFAITTDIKTQSDVSGIKIEARGLYIVCDGMGGHAAGEVASKKAVECLQTYFQEHSQQKLPDQNTIVEGIKLANQTLYQENIQQSRSGLGRMGTTLVMALVQNTGVAVAHVGDSRAYLISRKAGLQQLTSDHEVGQREIRRGLEPEIAYARRDAYQLTQALGPRDHSFIKPEVKYINVKEDCLLLLCSDGISDNDLIETHWEELLLPLINRDVDLEKGVNQLVNLANQYNGHDNITGVLIRLRLQPYLELGIEQH